MEHMGYATISTILRENKMASEMIGRQLFERLLIWDLFLACSMLWLYAGHVRMQKKT